MLLGKYIPETKCNHIRRREKFKIKQKATNIKKKKIMYVKNYFTYVLSE